MRLDLCALLVSVFALVAVPVAATAQPRGKIPKVGILQTWPAADFVERLAAFKSGLRALGYVEAQNIQFEFRSSEGKTSELPKLASELVEAQCRRNLFRRLRSQRWRPCPGEDASHSHRYRGCCRSGRHETNIHPGAPGWQRLRNDHQQRGNRSQATTVAPGDHRRQSFARCDAVFPRGRVERFGVARGPGRGTATWY